jgi:YHS domain-containing protein
LDGNCPVCLVELNRTIPGQAELTAVLGGYRYLFAGAQQREMFLGQPLKYAAAAYAIGSGLPAAGASSAAEAEGGSMATAPSGSAEELPGAREPGTDRSTDARAPQEDLPEPFPAALAGYCPVSILDESRWVRGKEEHAVDFDGHRYLLAGPDQRQKFLSDPTRYVPALGGDCVVSLRDDGQRIEGSVYHAVIHRSRQYLFPSAAQKERFKQNPAAYENVDLGLAGLCPVSLVDRGQEVSGQPQFTAWHNGLRYQLAGPEQLEAFHADAERYALEAARRMSRE